MINGAKITKVSVIWATIVYLGCVLIAWLLPSIYTWGAGKLVHFGAVVSQPSLSFTDVILGLILWDILVAILVWLFVLIYNKFK